MLQDSSDWLEARKPVDHHISRANERLESWQEITYTVEAVKTQNAELKVGLAVFSPFTLSRLFFASPSFCATLKKQMAAVVAVIHHTCFHFSVSVRPFSPQLFLKELQQWQGQVDETNTLADKLLTLYAHDDTHKVTQVNNNMVTTWTHISKRYF